MYIVMKRWYQVWVGCPHIEYVICTVCRDGNEHGNMLTNMGQATYMRNMNARMYVNQHGSMGQAVHMRRVKNDIMSMGQAVHMQSARML